MRAETTLLREAAGVSIVRRLPLTASWLLALALVAMALAVRSSAALSGALIFDRTAINAGEYWRIATSSLVHFSFGHLAGDALVLLVAVWLLGERPTAEIAALLVGGSAASGLAILLFAPELRWYGGLSGVAHAAVVYLALLGARRRGTPRVLSCLTLLIIATTLASDVCSVRFLAASHLGAPVVVANMSHLGAVVFAAGLAFAPRYSSISGSPAT